MNKKDYRYTLRWAKKFRAINILGGSCLKCGEDDPIILTFHHKDPSIKEHKPSAVLNYRWSIIRQEIEKCDLLCTNCHCSAHIIDDRQAIIKNNLLKLSGTDKCTKCGYRGLALDFHHLIKKDKVFSFGQLVGRKFSLPPNVILEELEKCIVLCHGCHAKEHFGYKKFNELLPSIRKKAIEHKERPPMISRERVIRLLAEKHTKASIARMLGCAKSTITYCCK